MARLDGQEYSFGFQMRSAGFGDWRGHYRPGLIPVEPAGTVREGKRAPKRPGSRHRGAPHHAELPGDREAAGASFARLLDGLLADLHVGVAHIGADLRPVQFSSSYGKALVRCGLLTEAPATFDAAVAPTLRLFTAAFRESIADGRAETVVFSDRMPVGLFLRAERHGIDRDGHRNDSGLLVLRGAARSCAHTTCDPRGALLQDAYGLTTQEATIALAVVAGRSVTDIAAGLGISMNTIRTHLKRIYDKAGVSGQTALAHLVLSGPIGWLGSRDAVAASPAWIGVYDL